MVRNPFTDEELLQKVATCGDSLAITLLFSRHESSLCAVARAIVSREQDVEDVIQSTKVCVLQSATSFQNRGSVVAWMKTITCHLAIDLLRRNRFVSLAETAVLDKHTTHSTLDVMILDELQDTLHSKMAELPESLRLPLQAYYFQGRTQQDIANTMGVTQRAVHDRLNRARYQLRKALQVSGFALVFPLQPILSKTVALSALSGTTSASLVSGWVQSVPLMGCKKLLAAILLATVTVAAAAGGAYACHSKGALPSTPCEQVKEDSTEQQKQEESNAFQQPTLDFGSIF